MPDLASRTDLHLPSGCATDGTDPVVVTPEQADWRYAGLRIVRLAPGESRTLATGPDELAVLPLSGGCVVETGGQRLALAGRDSVFARVTDFVYVGLDSELRITSSGGGDFALPSARAGRSIDAYRGDARAVSVELRGAGSASRQLNNFLGPGEFEADRLTAVEVLTPRGNWSSYPPHKHDTFEPGGEAELEEIYYFQISGGEHGFGAHRTYDRSERWDVTVTVHNHDVFLVPRGYHGPCMAAPDYDMFYLNVLAGPGAERTLAFSDDPPHHHVRAAWEGMAIDPRLPMTGPEGPVAGASRAVVDGVA